MPGPNDFRPFNGNLDEIQYQNLVASAEQNAAGGLPFEQWARQVGLYQPGMPPWVVDNVTNIYDIQSRRSGLHRNVQESFPGGLGRPVNDAFERTTQQVIDVLSNTPTPEALLETGQQAVGRFGNAAARQGELTTNRMKTFAGQAADQFQQATTPFDERTVQRIADEEAELKERLSQIKKEKKDRKRLVKTANRRRRR